MIEAKRGFANTMSSRQDYKEITEGLGESFEVSLNTYKPFACGIVIHPTIDGCVQLKKENALTGAEVEKIELTVSPHVLELTGKKTPQVGLEGKFSVYHSAAVAVLYGAAGEKEYSDECARDPSVIALRDRVQPTIDEKMRDDEARIRIVLKDGRVLQKHVTHAIGSLEHPMSDADLDAKFHVLVDDVLGKEHASRLIALAWDIEKLGDAADIARACAPTASGLRQRRA